MNLLLSPALRLILSPTDLRSLDVAVLHQRISVDLLTFFFLLRIIVGDIGCVTSLVIRVITLNYIIILSLLHHLYFVNTSLTITTRGNSSNSTKAHISVISSLSGRTRLKTLTGTGSMFLMVTVMVIISLGIKWEGSLQISLFPGIITELASSKDTVSSNKENKESLSKTSHFLLSLQVLSRALPNLNSPC